MPGVKRPWIIEERPMSPSGQIQWGWRRLGNFGTEGRAIARLERMRANAPKSYECRVRKRVST